MFSIINAKNLKTQQTYSVQFSLGNAFHLFLNSLKFKFNLEFSNLRGRTQINLIYGFTGMYLLKVNSRNARSRCEICSELTINTPERRHWRRSPVFIVNFEHISHPAVVFLLLTSNM